MTPARRFLADLGRGFALFGQLGKLRSGLGEIFRALGPYIRRVLRGDRRRSSRRDECCIAVPDVYKRPDPLIYAQYYLLGMGLSVTWDNPDVQLAEPDPAAPNGFGAPVSSSALDPNHVYRVQVRVWNGSYDAPAIGLPVHLSYLSFGAGTTSHPIATTLVDLGVKGSAHHPAFAYFDWTTPPAGHYCLQARLEWADDANPNNNLGQENVNVGTPRSRAHFAFVIRNEAAVPRPFVMEADAYRLPDLPPCDDIPVGARGIRGRNDTAPPSRLAESRARWERAIAEQGYGRFAIPDSWTISIEPRDVILAPNEERDIRVSIEPDKSATPQALNVHAFVQHDGGRELVGGVTLYVNGNLT